MSLFLRLRRSSWAQRAVVGGMAISLCASVGSARADTASNLRTAETRLEAATARLAAAARARDSLQAQVATILVRVDAQRRALEGARSQIAEVQRRIDRLSTLIVAQHRAIDAR